MQAECANFEIVLMGRLLKVSRAGFYRWRRAERGGLTTYQQARAELQVKIISHHKQSHGTYGSPHITVDLLEAGTPVSVNTVAAHMRSIGLAGISSRTFKASAAIAGHESAFPPGLATEGSTRAL